MRRESWLLAVSAVPFVITQLVLSYFVQTTGGTLCSAVSYFVVLLAFVFSMTSLSRVCTLEYNLVRMGLLITLLADYFLVLKSPAAELSGVITFIFVQLAYFLALVLCDENRTRRIVHIAVRGGITLLIIPAALIILGESADMLAIASAIYYANLVCNMVFAFLDFRRWWLFGVGMFFFALCDASIGFTFLANEYLGASEGGFIYAIANADLNLAWVFYVPCLTLISLSTHFAFARKGDC